MGTAHQMMPGEQANTNNRDDEKKSSLGLGLSRIDSSFDVAQSDLDRLKYVKEIALNARESPYKSWLESCFSSHESSNNSDTSSEGIDENSSKVL